MHVQVDWRGAYRVAQLMVFALLLVGSAHLGYTYAAERFESAHAEPAFPSPVVAPAPLAPLAFSTSTPPRTIDALSPEDVIPSTGKFILADLSAMTITLYQDGTASTTFPIQTKGKPGTPWETPSGYYGIGTKEEDHFSTIGKVYMPYSMQFYGNYFIHGWTTYPDGTPTPPGFSGGCIKLATEDAAKVYAFADIGTRVFVYDPAPQRDLPPLPLASLPLPRIAAESYLIADIDTGAVYAEKDAAVARPIASVTKLMTALVANETISFDKKLSIAEGALTNPRDPQKTHPKRFVVGDLLYPLLMQSSNHVADTLAAYYGTEGFVRWMNAEAAALGMTKTVYADPSGLSPENVSTPEDLVRLAAYLVHKKSFIFDITRSKERSIVATDGSRYPVLNVNAPADASPFSGGKIGYTDEARNTMVSVLDVPQASTTRRLAIVVLGTDDQAKDTGLLARWILARAEGAAQTACASCAQAAPVRSIEL